MKDMRNLIKIAMTSLLTLTTTTTLVNSASATASDKMEKCYGIVKTAMNDCQTATQACAGSATKDRQGDAFLFLPKGSVRK